MPPSCSMHAVFTCKGNRALSMTSRLWRKTVLFCEVMNLEVVNENAHVLQRKTISAIKTFYSLVRVVSSFKPGVVSRRQFGSGAKKARENDEERSARGSDSYLQQLLTEGLRGCLIRIICCVWNVSRWETACLNVPPPDWFLPLLRYVHFFFTPFVAFVNSPKLPDPSSSLDLVHYKATVDRLLKRLRSFPRNRTQQNICFKFFPFIKYSNDTPKIE